MADDGRGSGGGDVLSLTDDEENGDLDDELSAAVELSGTLSKWTNYIHGWQDRYIVLKNGTISYYKSEQEAAVGCRGAVSLSKAVISAHEFDDCRFDVGINDCLWYLRASSSEERYRWITTLELHKQAESGSEHTLRRHGSRLSLTSTASLSTTSTSSFKKMAMLKSARMKKNKTRDREIRCSRKKRSFTGELQPPQCWILVDCDDVEGLLFDAERTGLREKLAEMETFKDILCHQVDNLQNYFDACASAVSQYSVHDMISDDINEIDDSNHAMRNGHPNDLHHMLVTHRDSGYKDDQFLLNILQQHGAHAIDFKGESSTFKATTAGILATLAHCLELMSQREDAWKKRLEREVEKRKKLEEAYKSVVAERNKLVVLGGPDYEEGPHSILNEEEFFDAVDATLDKLEKQEEQKQQWAKEVSSIRMPKTSLDPSHHLYTEIDRIVDDHISHADMTASDVASTWTLVASEGEMKVYKREVEDSGTVIYPLKAVHTVKGITGHELCHYFWDPSVRMEWENTLETTQVLEWLSKDTHVAYQSLKRIWPAAQRDSIFWSTIRHCPSDDDEGPDYWIVVNHSTDGTTPPNMPKCIRLQFNVAMICQTVVKPPVNGMEMTRDSLTCRIQYSANVNPGGWVPASVIQVICKREAPKFLKTFTAYVQEKTKNKPILF